MELDNSPIFIVMDLMARLISPYDLDPFGSNPLTGLLNDVADFPALASGPIKVCVTATCVRTRRGKVFRNQEIAAEVLLASACLASMFQAIEIDGEATGTAAMPAIPPSRRWCVNASHGTQSWSR
jgi:NTE family protein